MVIERCSGDDGCSGEYIEEYRIMFGGGGGGGGW